MINKYCDGLVPDYASLVTPFDSELSTTAANVVGRYHDAMEKWNSIQHWLKSGC